MRLNYLELLRYGKFTDRRIAFPAARRDFHLVIGPNEAGKSTLRNAVVDLLFGFPVRTPLDFIHRKADLRLGAGVWAGDSRLEFLRFKANKNSLRMPDESILPDAALEPFLGQASRAFFDKMFGLDHPRLVEGGNSILNAHDDVGQVLFQAAAGVAGLGRVRDALEQEADGLWAPTKSAKRSYYVARADLDEATEELKEATVRTRQWAEEQERVRSLEDCLEQSRVVQLKLGTERNRLERVRRVGPALRELAATEQLLAQLGPCVSLPFDAAQTANDADVAYAMAAQRLALRQARRESLEAERAGIRLDNDIIDLADAIEALEASRHQYGAHPATITRLQGQVALLWQDISLAARQLGWSQVIGPAGSNRDTLQKDIAALYDLLPGLPIRRQMEHLLREHGVLVQALEAAVASQTSRQAEAQALRARLASMPHIEASPALDAAMTRARAVGDAKAALNRMEAIVSRAGQDLQMALDRLGEWVRSQDELQTMTVPTLQTVAELLKERQGLAFESRSAIQRYEELRSAAAKAALDVHQYRQLHHPISHEDVAQARGHRDALWSAIRSGVLPIQEGGDDFQNALGRADSLADDRHEKANEAARLQSLQHQLEQDERAAVEAQQRASRSTRALEALDARWQAKCLQMNLTGMPLEQMSEWLAFREHAIQSARDVARAKSELDALKATHASIAEDLRAALVACCLDDTSTLPPQGTADLVVLRAHAEAHTRRADELRIQRDAWYSQERESRPILQAAAQSVESAQARMDAWTLAWQSVVVLAGLQADLAPAAAQGALVLIETIAEKLAQLRQLQTERIETMERELEVFIGDANKLAERAGLSTYAKPVLAVDQAFRISKALALRLADAWQAKKQADRLAEQIDEESSQMRAAEEAIAEAKLRIRPLMDAAGAKDPEQLKRAIARSDQHRLLVEKLQSAQERLVQDGDGLDRDTLQAEVEAIAPEALAIRLHALEADTAQATDQQSTLSVELAQARNQLGAIAGADRAARAEARRQEALARMADTAERYIKVYTAARLLRWSIDRYREEKQGPMLARASAVFSGLTLGSFERLRVDFDKEPMVLEGQRRDGSTVGIPGMSDGTRDQLYLALRLAALELHLQQAPSLPFIADDLFINYDDARSEAGLRALAELSTQTQVIFLSHHDHLVSTAQRVFGEDLNVIVL